MGRVRDRRFNLLCHSISILLFLQNESMCNALWHGFFFTYGNDTGKFWCSQLSLGSLFLLDMYCNGALKSLDWVQKEPDPVDKHVQLLPLLFWKQSPQVLTFMENNCTMMIQFDNPKSLNSMPDHQSHSRCYSKKLVYCYWGNTPRGTNISFYHLEISKEISIHGR